MAQNTRRLVIAALASLLCLGANFLWYHSLTRKAERTTSRHALAELSRLSDQVQRKPTDRLTWEEIGLSEELYLGEAIRTSDKGSAEIRFKTSKLTVELEPSSVIILEEQDGKMNLGLLKGGLFAKPASESTSDIVVTAGASRLSLNGAEVSVGRSGESVDVQVLKGRAQLESAGKRIELQKGQNGLIEAGKITQAKALQVQVPTNPVYINPETRVGFAIPFKPLAGDYEYELWGGHTRSDLKKWPVQKQESADRISAQVKVGSFVWQLVAKPRVGGPAVKSMVYYSQVAAQLPPQILYPQTKQTVLLTPQEPQMVLQWMNPGKLENLHLDVFKLSDEGKPQATLASIEVDGETSLKQAFKEAGRYAMRVSGQLKKSDKTETLTSAVHIFDVKNGEEVVRIEPLPWGDDAKLSVFEYTSDVPQLQMQWPPTPLAVSWRARVAPASDDLELAEALELKEPKLVKAVPRNGDYQVQVDAIDSKGRVVARTEKRIMQVKAKPLPIAPQLVADINADNEGRAHVSWKPVQDAHSYIVWVKDGARVVQKLPVNRSASEIEDLNPGRYQLSVQSVDAYGRVGLMSPARALTVPDESSVRAPAFKKIKVK